MSRYLTASLAAIAAIALAACSDVPVTPDTNSALPQSLSLGVSQSDDEDQVVDGEILVKLKDNKDLDKVAKEKGLAIGRKGFKDEFVVLKGNKGSEKADADDLAKDSRVEWAEPNYLRQPTIDARLWAFYNPGGLNMSFSNGSGPIPSSYASVLDADEDNVTLAIGNFDPAYI